MRSLRLRIAPGRHRGAALAAAALASVWAFAATAAAQVELPRLGPGDWRAVPQPNGDETELAVFWKIAPAEKAYLEALSEALKAKKEVEKLEAQKKLVPPDLAARARPPVPPSYEYAILVSGTPEGAFVRAKTVAAAAALARESLDILGPGARDSDEHFVTVNVTTLAGPAELADAALALEKEEARRTPGEKATIERLRALLGERTLNQARERLAAAGVRTKEDLLAHHLEGYLGGGGLLKLILDREWRVKLAVRGPDGAVVDLAGPVAVRLEESLFDWARLNNFVIMVLLGALVLGFIRHARKNPNLFLRRIGGLDAVDEALGRATEMGKPVLFVHGLRAMDSISTVAAVNILGEVAKKIARYDSKLLCANNDPIVLAVSQETVKEAYLDAGRPDAYNSDDVFFVAAEQFSYVAAVDGIMVRQKPAANLYAGYFYAESLILAETGATTGAIQIAATDSYTQLPFFVTTCDYTLMGEELYAASAYLSRDPLLLGSLKGQDVGKALICVILIAGIILETAGVHWITSVLLWAS